MENEMFTFVVCTHLGHAVEHIYCNRQDANRKFDGLVASHAAHPEGLFVAYYCPSVGGLVNAWSAP
jgi:hypothetical protein